MDNTAFITFVTTKQVRIELDQARRIGGYRSRSQVIRVALQAYLDDRSCARHAEVTDKPSNPQV